MLVDPHVRRRKRAAIMVTEFKIQTSANPALKSSGLTCRPNTFIDTAARRSAAPGCQQATRRR
jgi:hypothetical protein